MQKYKDRPGYKKTKIGWIPEGWEVVHLDRVAYIQTGIAISQKNNRDSVELPYLRVANVQDGYLDLEHIKTLRVARSKVNRFMLKKGDVLMTEGGDFDKLGRGTVWQGQIAQCLHQNHVFAVRPNHKHLLSEFLSLQTGSLHGKRYFLGCSKQSTNLASINSTQLKAFPVLLPPLPEQKAIAEVLSVWDRAIENTDRLIQAKKKQFTGLVRKLISAPGFKRRHIREFTKEVSVRNKGQIISRVLSPMYVVFKINHAKTVSDFFLHWLASHEAKQRITKSAQGSVRETVSFADFGSIPFPMPALSEQKRIAETLNLAQREIDLLKRLAEKQKQQKRGLMQKLLTGEWRANKTIIKQYTEAHA